MTGKLTNDGLDPFQVYRDEIAAIPRISPERTRELGFQAENGSASAVVELTLTHLHRLFPKVLAKVGWNADAQDCLQEASIDLLQSARNYHPSEHDGSFNAYVDYRVQRRLQETSAPTYRSIHISSQVRRYVRIWQRVQDAVFEKTGNRLTLEETVDFLPVKFLRKTNMWKKAEARLKKTNGGAATPEEVERETRRSIKTGRTLRCVQDASAVMKMERMDVCDFEPHAPAMPEQQAIHAELIAHVRSMVLTVLNARERFVIERRYLTEKSWTQKQIAEYLHCDKMSISRLEAGAIEKLSQIMNRGVRVSSSGREENAQDADEYELLSVGLPPPKIRLIEEVRKKIALLTTQQNNGKESAAPSCDHPAAHLFFLTLSAFDGTLNAEERKILSSLYLAPEPKTESVLGKELSLSPTTVNNRKKQAIDKLARAIMEAMAS